MENSVLAIYFFLSVVWKCHHTVSVEKSALIFIFDSLCVIHFSNFWVPSRFWSLIFGTLNMICVGDFFFLLFFFFYSLVFLLYLFLLTSWGCLSFLNLWCVYFWKILAIISSLLLQYFFFSFCDFIYMLDHLRLSYGPWMHCSCFVLFCFYDIFLLCISVWLIFIGLSVSSPVP